MRIAGLVSIVLHGLILAALLWPSGQWAGLTDAPDQPVTVELLMREQQGAGETDIRPPAPQPRETAAPTPPAPKPEEGEAVAMAPPPPPSPQPSSPPPPAPKIMIGGTDSPSSATVIGEQVVPASPDDKARNRPPVFPVEAALRGEYGSVQVIIHVAADGSASAVGVIHSSGSTALDRAAMDAVSKWRFRPAVKNGVPVPFDYQMTFMFTPD